MPNDWARNIQRDAYYELTDGEVPGFCASAWTEPRHRPNSFLGTSPMRAIVLAP